MTTRLADLLLDALAIEKHGVSEPSVRYETKIINNSLCHGAIGGLNTLRIFKGIVGVPCGFDTLQRREIRLPILHLWHASYVQVHIAWICPSGGGIGQHRGQFVMEVGQEEPGGVRETKQVDPVGLIKHQLVTMSVPRGVGGNICDSAAWPRVVQKVSQVPLVLYWRSHGLPVASKMMNHKRVPLSCSSTHWNKSVALSTVRVSSCRKPRLLE